MFYFSLGISTFARTRAICSQAGLPGWREGDEETTWRPFWPALLSLRIFILFCHFLLVFSTEENYSLYTSWLLFFFSLSITYTWMNFLFCLFPSSSVCAYIFALFFLFRSNTSKMIDVDWKNMEWNTTFLWAFFIKKHCRYSLF